MLVLKVLVGLHRTVQLQLLQHYWLGHIEWFALETNRNHSVTFEIASKFCISDSFVDHDGYSISSKGLLPTVVDIMISVHFQGKIFNITVIQVYAPTSNAEEAEVKCFYGDL